MASTKYFSFVILVYLVAGCATRQATIQGYVGRNIYDVIADHGPPSQSIPDGKGGTIYVFRRATYSNNPGYVHNHDPGQSTGMNAAMAGAGSLGYALGGGQPAGTSERYKQTLFYARANGTIYQGKIADD